MVNKKSSSTASSSAIGRIKERSSIKKQRTAIILMIAAVVFLVAALLVVSYIVDIYVFEDVDAAGTRYYAKKVNGVYALYHKNGEVCDIGEGGYYVTAYGTLVKVDPESGECSIYAVVDTEGTEVQDFGTYVLMFKQLTYDAGSTNDQTRVIKSIEVHNANGSYTFSRNEGGNFVIKDAENVPYSKESFAQLAVACGYTLSTRRLQDPVKLSDGSVDYSEYGLVNETRVRTEVDESGNEIEVEYEYSPAWYVITTMSGESYKVTVGDKTVTGTGYYARYEGRDTIYVIGAMSIEEFLLGKIEVFVQPTIVYPMSVTDYFNVSDFVIRDNIDYDRIYEELAKKFTAADSGSKEFLKAYEDLFIVHSHKVCDLYFADLTLRKGTMNEHIPYVSKLPYAEGYYLNSSSVDTVLSALATTDFGEVVKISPSLEELKEYGLDRPEYVISFLYKTKNNNGETDDVENFVDVSKRDGTYYAYSEKYGMIVTVNESSFDFLEWDETEWYDTSYIQVDIANIDKLIVESQGFKSEFEIDDSVSKYFTYVGQSGSSVSVKIGEDETKEYKIQKDSESGRYLLFDSGKPLIPAYTGDYLLTPVTYTKKAAAADNYLFAESEEEDLNGDGETDAVCYYFYDILKRGEEYYLIAQILYTDLSGNQISEAQFEVGKIAYSSEYYCTDNGYIYFTAKNSGTGATIDELYGKDKRGFWSKGNLFVTSGGEYIWIDVTNGAWVCLDSVSCGIYFADKDDSRLSDRAVELPAKYDENGKLVRYAETYYAITDKKLSYDSGADKLIVENKVNGSISDATYGECTIGLWGNGNYYVIDGRLLIVVNSETGEWGKIDVVSNPTYVADVFANGTLLDYTVEREGVTEYSKLASAMQNFQEFYKGMLSASFEGLAEISDEKKSELSLLDDFSRQDAANPCVLKITIIAKDLQGNERNVVYRFYRYSERHAYITIEMLDSDDPSTSDSKKAYGNFYVLNSFAEKLIADAQRAVNGETVVYNSKY